MVDARQVAEKNVKESQAKSKQIIESAQQSAAQLRKEADSYATGRQNIAEQADASSCDSRPSPGSKQSA